MPPCSPDSPAVPQEIPDRDPDRRRARAWTALGFLTGCTLVWGSIAALNHWFLGFHAWPQTDEPGVQRLVVTDPAPARVAQRPAPAPRVGVAANGGVLAIFPAGDRSAVAAIPVARSGEGRSGGTTRIPVTGPGGVLAPDRAPDAQSDPDGDGVPNVVERRRGTSPTNADSDGDGMPDAWEVRNGFDPKNPGDAGKDSDGDGVPNAAEFKLGDDPRRVDTGRTGTDDGQRDSDGDGVSNADEILHGTDPAVADQPPESQAPSEAGQEPTPSTGEESQPEQPAEPQPAPEPEPTPEPQPAEPTPAPEPQPAEPPATDPTTGGVEAPVETPVTEPAPAPERSQAPETPAPEAATPAPEAATPAPEAAQPTPAP